MSAATDPRAITSLVALGMGALGLSQRELGAQLGSSLRTAQRWATGRAQPSADQLKKLAALVHPRNPTLAAEIAAAVHETLESLGLVLPPSPPEPVVVVEPVVKGPPETPGDLVPLLVEAVVAAAAEALDQMPRVVRPAVTAAFVRAQAARLSVADVVAVLDPASPLTGSAGPKPGSP
jgi:transcriptional regulator with XRE-family HTH domain